MSVAPRHIAIALAGERAATWLERLADRPADDFGIAVCEDETALRALDPEVVVGHQEALLGLLADPNPKLKWVHLLTTGTELAVGAILPGNPQFMLTKTGGINASVMREYALMAFLHFAKNVPGLMDDKNHRRWRPHVLPTLAGETLICVGTGTIGTAVAEAANALDMQVLGVSLRGRPSSAFASVFTADQLLDVLPRGRFVLLAAPVTAATRQIIDDRAVAAMRPGTILVNVARGALIDDRALLAGLRTGKIAGVALDAFWEEPLPQDSPWWDEPNAILTPHLAGRSALGGNKAMQLFCENLQSFRRGEKLRFEVDPQLGY